MNPASARDRARVVLGPYLVDVCTITRFDQPAFDPPLDPETLEEIEIIPDENAVYSGPCLVHEVLDRRSAQEGGGPVQHRQWDVLIPHTAPEFVERDVVIVTSSGNPQAVGIRLSVVSIDRATYQAFRRLITQDESGALIR